MFKLIKLAFYAVIGYALYELYQGMMQQQGGGSSQRSRSFGQSPNRGQLTGAGEGMEDVTGDASGTEMRHTVGRGVVR